MSRSTTAQVRDKDRHLTLSQHDTDAPVLPITQLEKLKEIYPERMDWVFNETTKEGDFRRQEIIRVNTFTFTERILGMIAGLAIGLAALYTSYSLAMAGHDWVAGIIGGTTVVGLVSAFLIDVKRQRNSSR
jgi:hypothetical protein